MRASVGPRGWTRSSAAGRQDRRIAWVTGRSGSATGTMCGSGFATISRPLTSTLTCGRARAARISGHSASTGAR
eukprot:1209103-Heterocapsa_arctica.AAC.1